MYYHTVLEAPNPETLGEPVPPSSWTPWLQALLGLLGTWPPHRHSRLCGSVASFPLRVSYGLPRRTPVIGLQVHPDPASPHLT